MVGQILNEMSRQQCSGLPGSSVWTQKLKQALRHVHHTVQTGNTAQLIELADQHAVGHLAVFASEIYDDEQYCNF